MYERRRTLNLFHCAIQTVSCLGDATRSIYLTPSPTIEHGANYNHLGMSHTVEHSLPILRAPELGGVTFRPRVYQMVRHKSRRLLFR